MHKLSFRVANTVLVAMLLATFLHSAAATTWSRRNPTDVIPPDWEGYWQCNIDGRSATAYFRLQQEVTCSGDICRTGAWVLKGSFSDSGGAWRPLNQRPFNASDPTSPRRDHLLPLRYNNTDDWLLIMHTVNRAYASGYTRWAGIPFGLQCHR